MVVYAGTAFLASTQNQGVCVFLFFHFRCALLLFDCFLFVSVSLCLVVKLNISFEWVSSVFRFVCLDKEIKTILLYYV